MIQPTRRSLITGLAALVAAPTIVRVNHLMPISVWPQARTILVHDYIASLGFPPIKAEGEPVPFDPLRPMVEVREFAVTPGEHIGVGRHVYLTKDGYVTARVPANPLSLPLFAYMGVAVTSC